MVGVKSTGRFHKNVFAFLENLNCKKLWLCKLYRHRSGRSDSIRMLQHLHDVLNFPLRHFTNIEKKVAQRLLPVFDIPTPLGTLKSVHFKKTVAQSSFLSKWWSFSMQHQLMLYWKWPPFWKKWGSFNCVLKMNGL